MTTILTQKNAKKFVCINCDFNTSNKFDYNKHLSTQKHKNNCLTTTDHDKNHKTYECDNCDRCFNDRAGLWRHKKNCSNDKISINTTDGQQELVQFLLKENSEFKQLMIEQNKHMLELAKNTGNNNNNTNTSNVVNNNQQFNLHFYLNETCKNAMNIMDFINQLPVSIKHLEDTGRLGFAEGISKIFIDGLKQINVTDRPIHCSDLKRETVYIKDNNEWNKESEQKTILTNAIKHVTHKNIKQISEWTKIHPEYNDSSSKMNDKYLQIVSESMSGTTQEETNKNYSKIVKNILKESVIDKTVASTV
jgi:PHD/YefM family antitoxin component YafN of YafNO toxin-antitoxin module